MVIHDHHASKKQNISSSFSVFLLVGHFSERRWVTSEKRRRLLGRNQHATVQHVGLRLPFVHSVASSCAPLCVGTMDSVMHRHSRSWLLYARGPRSGLGYRDAFAVLVRLGDPRLVPCFRCSFLIDMPPSTTPGSPSAAFAQFFANGTSLRHNISDSALPFTPSSASDGK